MVEHPPVAQASDEEMYRRSCLLRMIERLGAPVGDGCEKGRRSLSPGISSILDELDETVLARRLTLRNDRGEEMTLEVRSRRLFWAGFGEAGGNVGLPVSDLVVSRAAPEEVSAFVWVLHRFALAGPLSVESGRSIYKPALDEAGLTASALDGLSQKGVSDGTSAHIPSVRDFAETCRPVAQALLLVGPDGTLLEFGPATLFADLSATLDNFLSFQADAFDELPQGATLSLPGTSGVSLAFYADGQFCLAVCVAPEQEVTLQSAWADWLERQPGR